MPAETAPLAPKEWPHLELLAGWLLILVLQMLVFPCLCATGEAQVRMGLALDALFLVRLLVARMLREKNRSWVIYTLLLASSLLWIPLIFDRR